VGVVSLVDLFLDLILMIRFGSVRFFGGGLELYRLGVPSRLVIFPDENHWVLNHGNRCGSFRVASSVIFFAHFLLCVASSGITRSSAGSINLSVITCIRRTRRNRVWETGEMVSRSFLGLFDLYLISVNNILCINDSLQQENTLVDDSREEKRPRTCLLVTCDDGGSLVVLVH